MYPSLRSSPAHAPSPTQEAQRRSRVLSQNLIALGLTSFFSDVSSEMVMAVVPLFLTTSLGFSILGFGLFEAGYQATSAFFRVWGGAIADHRQQHKRTAATGYAISTATRLGLVASTFVAWLPAVPFLLADRIGKGIRTSPRDALISLSTAPDRLAMAFGVHRSLDTAGALLGPLLAFAVLSAAPGAFDAVFVISAIAGLLGVGVISLFAQEKPQVAPAPARPRVSAQWRRVLAEAGVRRLAIAAGMLSIFTVSDAFVYLVIQRTTDLSARYFPLLFVGTALVYLTLAVPVGRLADRIGAKPVLIGGHAALVVLYVALTSATMPAAIAVATLALLGVHYAATDGVVSAMVSQLVPTDIRASGISLVTVVIAVGKMISAGLFGTLWQSVGRAEALVVHGVAMAIAVVIAMVLLPSVRSMP